MKFSQVLGLSIGFLWLGIGFAFAQGVGPVPPSDTPVLCSNLPALTGDTTSSAGSCTTSTVKIDGTTPGTGVVTALGNAAGGTGGFALQSTVGPCTAFGTTSGTCAQGNDSRITGAFQSIVRQTFCAAGCSTTVASGATGTYTPTVGMVYADVECYGSGAGGGGAAADATGISEGGGGGAGGYSKVRLTAAQIGASKTITIGALGAGGSAGNNAGSAGAAVSLGSLCVANGGTGGAGAASGNGSAGGAGGTAGTGDVAGTGMSGSNGLGSTLTTFFVATNNGGSTQVGGGGIGTNTGGNGGTGYGSGGSGGTSYASASNEAGGPGTAGIVIVTEYIN